MHEMALMSTAMDIVLAQAEQAGAGRVTKVFMTIGEGRDVIEGLLCDVFGYLARDTVAAGAELIVRRMPYLVRCNACGRVYRIDVHDRSTFPCPACGAEHACTPLSGMEFRVESLEVCAAQAPGAQDDQPEGARGAA